MREFICTYLSVYAFFTSTEPTGFIRMVRAKTECTVHTDFYLAIISLLKLLIDFVCMGDLPVCVCALGAWCHGGQKRVPDMLVLESQTIVSRRVGAGAQPGVARAAISPAPLGDSLDATIT